MVKGVSKNHAPPIPFNYQVVIVPGLDRTGFFSHLLSLGVRLALAFFFFFNCSISLWSAYFGVYKTVKSK